MSPKERAYVEEDLRGDAEDRADAEKALANGNVVDEIYDIREAIQFVLYDLSGLVYFLRTSDDAIFYWEDEESEDLWCDDKPIFDSKSKPLSSLIVTSTATDCTEFDITFEGLPVPITGPFLMIKDGDFEPPLDDFVEDMTWDEIESKYRKVPTFWDRLRGFKF